ncbi:MAG: DUF411 domain-containing protein [Cellvibrionaceae bacterium]
MSTLTRFAFLGLSAVLLLAGCEQEAKTESAAQTQSGTGQSVSLLREVSLDVYKSETCGCCQEWIDYMEEQAFAVTTYHPVDLAGQKQQLGIAPQYQSCHTAVSADGYVFEGHIPAKLVTRFLEEKPQDAIGLAVPGMPLGSPGMEVDDRFTPYQVLLLKKDGSTEVYASMETAAAQY